MVREISSGGLVIRREKNEWMLAVIEPQREPAKKSKTVLALPKGIVDEGEKPEQTAIREVQEETGLVASTIAKLADIKYVYVRSWGDNERVFKIVSFYLLRYESGTIGEISPEMRIEVKRAFWIPLKEAVGKLAYRGEKETVTRAQEYLQSHPEV
ncbi:MAG TPA: NUDIX domain-containing protein [Terriglobales bacterium]|jgi:8-oxo-dGTP pyrophosphatase MutT (NUDIX family)